MSAPLVSCILPTNNRREWVRRALLWFEHQDYGRKELIVVDDGADSVEDLCVGRGDIHYVRCTRSTVGAKRNIACEQAQGDLIAHFDDDDWYRPDRLSVQVATMSEPGVALCGVRALLYYAPYTKQSWRYVHPTTAPPWLTLLCYRRAHWQQHRFEDVRVGEDARFVRACPSQQIRVIDRDDLQVCTIHPGNTSPKQVRSQGWSPERVERLMQVMGTDWARFAPPPSDAPRATPRAPRAPPRASRVTAASPGLAIGVHHRGDGDRLRLTLASIRRHAPSAAVWILPDQPEPTSGCGGLPVLAGRAGAAAAFNRLMGASRAPVSVLIEAGAHLTGGALQRLVAALQRPGVGIAGPSTNLCWNEQAISGAPSERAPEMSIDAFATMLARRPGGSVGQELRPLHSLNDFCYAVRREVVDAIGEADEAYGLGPCWEMDYNIRAFRAGFQGHWVPSAYVHRRGRCAIRSAEEAENFERSRQLYQDRFCGLRLDGGRDPYHAHCIGEACARFAPVGRIATRVAREPDVAEETTVGSSAAAMTGGAVDPAEAAAPLVSCIMPTADRRRFVQLSLDLFQRQDYPNRELVIVDDGRDAIGDLVRGVPGVRYIRLSGRHTIGAKRNLALAESKGAIIAHWDDDDWYSPTRLSWQVRPILAGEADLTGLHSNYVLQLPDGDFWTVSDTHHRDMFEGDLHGGTLVYRREILRGRLRYPEVDLAEDAELIRRVRAEGARIRRLENPAVFVYVRHGRNAWRFQVGTFLGQEGWSKIAAPAVFDRDTLAVFRAAGAG